AEKIVGMALAEQADFMVLSGDILDIELAGPHGVSFLLRQFARLAERQISVYWAGGRVDRPERWPAALNLPGNVYRFSSRRPEDFLFPSADAPLARLTGLSRPRGGKLRAADFWPDPDSLPTIVAAHGRIDRAALAGRNINYWALGGKHRRTTLLDGPQPAHYPGTPQGRGPADLGAHGCTLVEIDEQGRVEMRNAASDVVRWCHRRATVHETTTGESLEQMLADQLRELRSTAPDLDLLVVWSIAGAGPVVSELRRGELAETLLARLRRRFGHDRPVAWSAAIELEPEAAVPPAWSQQDSLLGDFLRALPQFDGEGTNDPADLSGPLELLAGQTPRGRQLDRLLRLSDPADRRRMLQKAAALGASLLTSEDKP
ncbi:MAG: hypothetical protein B7Z73_16800, partial [Planctomycetia bacterium 21-64-5]